MVLTNPKPRLVILSANTQNTPLTTFLEIGADAGSLTVSVVSMEERLEIDYSRC